MMRRMFLWHQVPTRGGAVVLRISAAAEEEPTAADYRRFARLLAGMADILDDDPAPDAESADETTEAPGRREGEPGA